MYRTYKFALEFCLCIEKRKSISGLCPWTPIGGFAPGPHRGPGPHKAQARRRCALRVFTLCVSALNGAPNHPLPTGIRKQSYATGLYCQVKGSIFWITQRVKTMSVFAISGQDVKQA